MKFETIQWELGLVIPGGVDTTRTTIARSLILLSSRPDLWEQLVQKPGMIQSAVEELLRYITPLNNMFRVAAQDTEINGQPISAGDRLCLLYPSANRDESIFEDPDEIRLDRSPNPHVAFGLGTHFCLGANLARITLRVFFEELIKRIDKLEAIARALLNRPAILLADEPTGNLDSTTTADILALFARLHDEGQTVIIVTHEDEVAAHCRRVIRLHDGRIASDLPIEEDPAGRLLGTVPSTEDTC